MKSVRVLARDAERVKNILIKDNLLDFDFLAEPDSRYVYFPLRKDFTSRISSLNKHRLEIVEKNLKWSGNRKQLKQALASKLSEQELACVRRSYDIVGNIAILEIPPELKGKEKLVAEALLNLNKNLKTVLKKSDIHKGEFRTQKLAYVAGEKTKEALHKESNTIMRLDVERVYFSPRLSTERKRIAGQVKPGERVLVMFSGCGPYPLVISKNTKAKQIVGIEKNKVAHKYALENAALNKATNIKLICGDVRDEVPKLKGRFERILMPLPKDADMFLDTALSVAKKGSIIHIYLFLDADKFEQGKERIREIARKAGKRIRIIGLARCGQYSPSTFRVCVDFQIL